MNAISDFLVSNMIAVYFGYGLAFFVLGLALLISNRRESDFRFAAVIMPLALFGLLHGAHEWFEMFQLIAASAGAYVPLLWHEALRLILLAASFVMLLVFALLLLRPATDRCRPFLLVAIPLALWAASTAAAARYYGMDGREAIAVADVLARYLLGVPAAVLAAWALMAQQRIFRDSDMPEFGADLVWCAAALLLYGVVGQAFARRTALPYSTALDSANFLAWFGIPVQLFRAALATLLTVFMLRTLRVFEAEERRRFQASNQAKLTAQAAALEAERSAGHRLETVNQELKHSSQKLSLLVDISNTLNGRAIWPVPMVKALQQIVDTLAFAKAGLILLQRQDKQHAHVSAEVGYERPYQSDENRHGPHRSEAISLGEFCLSDGVAHCLHSDGTRIRFTLEEAMDQQECRLYMSPTVLVALPLKSGDRTIGSLVLANDPLDPSRLSSADLNLMVGIAQELGLSVENALLHRQAHERERMLAELLGKIVDAQEGERQRIARELHDATGQSLTAVALGLRGIEAQLERICEEHEAPALLDQLNELQSYSTGALKELHGIIADLRPPQLDELGLMAAIRWYIQTYEQRWGIRVQYCPHGDDATLPDEYKTVLFRILQEALLNVAKHAQASQVDVDLETTDTEVRLTIRDHGRGFAVTDLSDPDESRSQWGLAGMKERTILIGGRLDIVAAPGQGTTVAVHAPLPAVQGPDGLWQKA